MGTICRGSQYGNLTVTLSTDESTVLNNMPAITEEIKNKLVNGNAALSSDLEVTILNVASGSAVITAAFESVTTNDDNIESAASNFQTATASGTSFAGYTVVSSSSTYADDDDDDDDDDDNSSSGSSGGSGGLIVGILVAVLAGIAYVR